MKDNMSSKDNTFIVSPLEANLTSDIASLCENAICQLWDKSRGTFWRSTEHRARIKQKAQKQAFFPTVSYRSAEALLDLISRFPEWISKENKELIINSLIQQVLKRKLNEVESTLDKGGSASRNPFTTSLYLITLSKACAMDKLDAQLSTDRFSRISYAIKELLSCCTTDKSHTSNMHPFIQFHILRATTIAIPFVKEELNETEISFLQQQIITNTRSDIENLLARHVLRELSPSDAVALIFCAATLAFAGRDEDRHYILPSLEVGFEAQDSSGCWPLGRVVREDKDKGETQDFEISTYEIAWAISETLLKLSRKNRESLLEGKASLGFERLLLACKYARKSSIELTSEDQPKKGWCSDYPYKKPFIESWTSATVLQSVISLQELIEDRTREEILGSFMTLDPRDSEWPSWLKWEAYKLDGEPEDHNPILQYLDEKIVKPINKDPRNSPSAEDESVSVLLFGPPGTSKTTLVQGVASGLNWPIVFLSPGDFIKEGLEYIEAQSRIVFERLQKLSRVVVIFDECDELFRDRRPSNESEQMRGITAFVTASMLPKLQDLHDRGKVVFFICTNKFETLDPAIKRSGRIDHIIGVGPPQREYRKRLIANKFKSLPDGAVKEFIVAELTDQTDRFIRKEITRVCDLLLRDVKSLSNKTEVRKAISNVIRNVKDSLTIQESEYSNFKKLKEKYSRPVTEGV
jgi:hypothetical protein